MQTSGQILLLESLDGSTAQLAERILGFGIETVIVPDTEEARRILEERQVPIAAVMIPTDRPSQNLKRELKQLRRVGPASGLMFVSAGKPPTADERKRLRSAGMQIALWEPYDDGTLRFQLNRALGGDREEHGRLHKRVPTYLLARIFVGGRAKDAVVYSLSEGGAFLETPRASMDGATIEVEIRLPSGHLQVHGTVMFSNVPGNLQRANVPMGMGIRFESLDEQSTALLEEYVRQRFDELNV